MAKVKSLHIFVLIIVISFIVLACCTIQSNCVIKNNTNAVIDAIEKIESQADTLQSVDSTQIANSNIRLSKDDIVSLKDIVQLHVEKVDNDYTVITIWAAVLSIIFLVFSFYSIYKIEETKDAMKELYERNREIAKEQLDQFKREAGEKQKEVAEQTEILQSTLASSQKDINAAIGNCKAQFTKLTKSKREEFDALLNELRTMVDNTKGA